MLRCNRCHRYYIPGYLDCDCKIKSYKRPDTQNPPGGSLLDSLPWRPSTQAMRSGVSAPEMPIAEEKTR